jgi:hypothetical protein
MTSTTSTPWFHSGTNCLIHGSLLHSDPTTLILWLSLEIEKLGRQVSRHGRHIRRSLQGRKKREVYIYYYGAGLIYGWPCPRSNQTRRDHGSSQPVPAQCLLAVKQNAAIDCVHGRPARSLSDYYVTCFYHVDIYTCTANPIQLVVRRHVCRIRDMLWTWSTYASTLNFPAPIFGFGA